MYIVAGVGRGGRLLAYEEHVDSAKIEIVVEGQSSESIVCGMLTGVKLVKGIRLVCDRLIDLSLTMTVFPLY
jgi:hypothetical protein